ncbi:uncharacterized protein LOC141660979 [Apium graveolens]|uniref:uncharacterized protein LOC141660979 n=1 Tax=Apium graveolens TaxID=4045 RepID=UPI003D7C1016
MNARKRDIGILQDMFNERDVQFIQSIPLFDINKEDSWFWIFDSKGDFTVRSSYRNLVGEYSTPDAGFWKKLWELEVPRIILFFLWRTCKLCLPKVKALIDKIVNIESICSWCRLGEKDTMHVLFKCSFAKMVWEASGLASRVQIMLNETVVDIFKHLFIICIKEHCVFVPVICWSIWNRRNNWLWNKVDMSVFGTKSAGFNLLADWKKAPMESTNI